MLLGDKIMTIDILKECKNYDSIVNYNYENDDFITDSIINLYQEQIFNSDHKNIRKIKSLDKIVMEYITNKSFNNFVKSYYLDEKLNYFDKNDLKLIELYDRYKMNISGIIKQNRWI